ncbi:SMI1/KNR4 family protein [Wielerella bovis]|uniref:SMI1/KNR4 family protein n=1 Tax=Wielerella bovis TaxID=2917790 RepID=UPI002018C771|nr:SMI1/KNR4 family protein [Wielerella bovis]ULJ60445.1 SMI1/KNR4 family protein [Wielerella bovis]ULJ62651.1 SMI1/KNR4 family protein [Wielerella bovis]ULJ64877.1 SMI1/KNR4 family protein [Wielerella bovis]ULJ67150.1 SMI1/KNR4 family protein [Wielerella bovis]
MLIAELKQIYENFYGNQGTDFNDILYIEKRLGIKLPNDFKEIARFYSGGLLGDIEHYSISMDSEPNLVNKTLELRENINLDNRYIVLAEPAESIIFLDIESYNVIWCDSTDLFSDNSDKWNSYQDFFSYLLLEDIEMQS